MYVNPEATSLMLLQRQNEQNQHLFVAMQQEIKSQMMVMREDILADLRQSLQKESLGSVGSTHVQTNPYGPGGVKSNSGTKTSSHSHSGRDCLQKGSDDPVGGKESPKKRKRDGSHDASPPRKKSRDDHMDIRVSDQDFHSDGSDSDSDRSTTSIASRSTILIVTCSVAPCSTSASNIASASLSQTMPITKARTPPDGSWQPKNVIFMYFWGKTRKISKKGPKTIFYV